MEPVYNTPTTKKEVKGKKKTLDDVIRDYEEKLADLESIKKYGFE